MRESGVLMHITSLPGPYGVGTMGKPAFDFVDFLEKAGQSYWQILPLTPTSYGDSPYQSPSSFAGNPYFIDLEELIEEGLLTKKECDAINWGGNSSYVDYEALSNHRLEVLKKAEAKGVKVFLPTDAVNADKFDKDANTNTSKTNETPEGWMGLDIADETIKTFSDVIANSKTVLWNGPMGVFEFDKFAKGTSAVAQAVAKATQDNGAFTLIGGGDSVAAINKNKLADKVSYVSTGGGAMLEYMEGKVLPGIKAIRGK